MSYIGNTNTTQAFTPAVDFFNGNGSTVAFTLSKPVASVAQVQAVISNVPQTPGTAYTVSGNTITFTSAPPSGTSNIYVYYTSPITQVIAPGQGTVTTTSLMDSSVTTAKIADGAVTPAKLSTGAPTWDTNGVVALSGGTQNSWGGGKKVWQASNAALAGQSDRFEVWSNAYYDGSAVKYISAGYASLYQSVNGAHNWLSAPSGSAGATATLTTLMTVDKDKSLALQGASSVTGTGISFPATQSASSDANTLDDYEEGTASLSFGSRTATGTWSTITVATYVKIGKLVTVRASIAGTSMAFAGATAYAYITGLPFGAAATSMGVFGTGAISATGLIGVVYAASTDAILYGANTTSAVNGIEFSVTYQTS